MGVKDPILEHIKKLFKVFVQTSVSRRLADDTISNTISFSFYVTYDKAIGNKFFHPN